MKTLKERFEEKIMYEPNTGCWIWIGAIDSCNYGRFNFQGCNRFAHRISYTLFNGNIPNGMLVCHNCDNTYCVNPNHLFLGTNMDNTKDKIAKQRHFKKLNKNQVNEIKNLYSAGLYQKDIATIYGIGQANVSCIVLNKTWAKC